MKFSTREDIEAPIDVVFNFISDFDGFEVRALRRGAEVTRLDTLSEPGIGAKWDVSFLFRNKERMITAEVATFDAPNGMVIASKSGGMSADVEIELVALSPNRTRLSIGFVMTPSTLSARLLLQSLKLAKSNLTKRFKLSVADYAQSIEKQHIKMA